MYKNRTLKHKSTLEQAGIVKDARLFVHLEEPEEMPLAAPDNAANVGQEAAVERIEREESMIV